MSSSLTTKEFKLIKKNLIKKKLIYIIYMARILCLEFIIEYSSSRGFWPPWIIIIGLFLYEDF
jgi:hypothetical protein